MYYTTSKILEKIMQRKTDALVFPKMFDTCVNVNKILKSLQKLGYLLYLEKNTYVYIKRYENLYPNYSLKRKSQIYQQDKKFLADYEEYQYIVKNIKKFYLTWKKVNTTLNPRERLSFQSYVRIQRGLWESKQGLV